MRIFAIIVIIAIVGSWITSCFQVTTMTLQFGGGRYVAYAASDGTAAFSINKYPEDPFTRRGIYFYRGTNEPGKWIGTIDYTHDEYGSAIEVPFAVILWLAGILSLSIYLSNRFRDRGTIPDNGNRDGKTELTKIQPNKSCEATGDNVPS